MVENGLQAHFSSVCEDIFHCHGDSKADLEIKLQIEALEYLLHTTPMNPGIKDDENPHCSVIQHKTNSELHWDGCLDL